jgi:hypothetical protein
MVASSSSALVEALRSSWVRRTRVVIASSAAWSTFVR